MVELPYALFDAQDELMMQILKRGAAQVSDGGKDCP
jgi:hypothetical protein